MMAGMTCQVMPAVMNTAACNTSADTDLSYKQFLYTRAFDIVEPVNSACDAPFIWAPYDFQQQFLE